MSPAPGTEVRQPTGDRATAKVRWIAAQNRAQLGQLRHVEASTPSTTAWVVIVVLVLLFSFGPLMGTATIVQALIFLPVWALIAGLFLWFLGSEKLLVLERGVIVGSFAPFLSPFAVPFTLLEASSISAIIGNQRTLGQLLANRGVSRASRTTIWSARAVTFIGLVPSAARSARSVRSSVPTPQGAAAAELGRDLWVFSVRSARRQEIVVQALAAALLEAQAPDAEQVVPHALPPRRLTVTVEDADHLHVPERWRSARLRAR